MRYLAISLLSLVTPPTAPVAVTLPSDEPWLRTVLVLLVSAALVALQLRRRQRNLGMPRALAE
jgi:hypothetical protein